MKLSSLSRYHTFPSPQKLPRDLPCGSDTKESACNAGDPGWIPGLGRSSGEGSGNPLQYYCVENPMDRGAWWVTDRGVAKSPTQLSDYTAAAARSLPSCPTLCDPIGGSPPGSPVPGILRSTNTTALQKLPCAHCSPPL